MSRLQTPLQVGALTLPNRIIMAPLTRCRAGAGRTPTALMAEYYVQRASAGLILSEATAVDPMGVGYPDTPGIWAEEQVAAWQTVTTAVHAAPVDGFHRHSAPLASTSVTTSTPRWPSRVPSSVIV